MYGGSASAPPPEMYEVTTADLASAVNKTLRWSIAERFHWTLDVVDALPLTDLWDFLQIEEGRSKARQEQKKGT